MTTAGAGMFDTGLTASASVGEVAAGVGSGVGLEVGPGVGSGVGFQVGPGVGTAVGLEVAGGRSVIDGRLAI